MKTIFLQTTEFMCSLFKDVPAISLQGSYSSITFNLSNNNLVKYRITWIIRTRSSKKSFINTCTKDIKRRTGLKMTLAKWLSICRRQFSCILSTCHICMRFWQTNGFIMEAWLMSMSIDTLVSWCKPASLIWRRFRPL